MASKPHVSRRRVPAITPIAALCAVLLGLVAQPGAVLAQRFHTQELDRQVYAVLVIARRCDKAALRAAIDGLKQSKKILDEAGKVSVEAASDAELMGSYIADYEAWIGSCSDKHTVKGVDGEVYGFEEEKDWRTAARLLDDAQGAAEACDVAAYSAAVKSARDNGLRLQDRRDKPSARATFSQISYDLHNAGEKLLRKCIDPCLVGRWRSESIFNAGNRMIGGDGIALTIKADGGASVDYGNMKLMLHGSGAQSTLWQGKAAAKIEGRAGKLVFISAEASEVMARLTDWRGRVSVVRVNGLGPILPDRGTAEYNCQKTALTTKGYGFEITFKKVE